MARRPSKERVETRRWRIEIAIAAAGLLIGAIGIFLAMPATAPPPREAPAQPASATTPPADSPRSGSGFEPIPYIAPPPSRTDPKTVFARTESTRTSKAGQRPASTRNGDAELALRPEIRGSAGGKSTRNGATRPSVLQKPETIEMVADHGGAGRQRSVPPGGVPAGDQPQYRLAGGDGPQDRPIHGDAGAIKLAASGGRIPVCAKRLGTIAIVEPDNQWWRELNLGSPEAIIKVFVQKSGCFGLVNRGRSLASRNLERAMADDGELQAGSNLGRGQVKAADYFLQPDIVSSNNNSGGNALGAIAGGLLGRTGFGAIAGGISVKKKEANVTLSVVNARTTEEEALTEGYARKSDQGTGKQDRALTDVQIPGGYSDTEIGRVVTSAYLDAYVKLVQQLGGLPGQPTDATPTPGPDR